MNKHPQLFRQIRALTLQIAATAANGSGGAYRTDEVAGQTARRSIEGNMRAPGDRHRQIEQKSVAMR